ncbi:MAG: CotH kinase family protein [Dysgonamonadaceae bacterium]|nr:CotH kinase family protein [Dysgonamonadaceae bacterium]
MKPYFWIITSLLITCGAAAQTQLTNLPTMYINTENAKPVVSKDNYLKATITVKSSVATEEVTNLVTEIKGRGNSTWGMAKKPYRLKLDKKANILGLPAKAKNWVLLANYADKTLIRNAVAFKISEITGLEFTPTVKFLDLYVNNDFLGNYMLTDQVEVNEKRVNVEEQDSTDIREPEVTGGYLLEIDGFAASELKWFTSRQGLKITIKYPKDDEIVAEQETYIRNYINNFESKLFATDFKNPETGYRSMVDTTSLINWYIACELTGNSDSFWSTYIYKRRSDNKLYFGPLWDFDIAFNNDNRLGNAVRKLMREHAHSPRTWIEQFWKDEWFQKAVERRWKALVDDNLLGRLTTYIDETAALMDASQKKNFQRWNILNTRVYRETYLFATYQQGTDFLKSYLSERINFLNESFVSPEPPQPTEPFVAEDFYYSILNKRTNNAIDVTGESTAPGALLMLWAPSDTDDGQLWKIEAIDNTYFRFLNKRSGLAMTANGWNNNLLQKELNLADIAQKWKITPVLTGGLYGIESAVAPDYYSVNNSGGSFENGTKVIVYGNRITESDNQQWYIQKREMIETPTGIIQAEKIPFTYHVSGNRLYIKNLPDNAVLRVFNLQGVRIKETRIAGEQTTVDLPQQGIYILNVISNEKVHSLKIIVS